MAKKSFKKLLLQLHLWLGLSSGLVVCIVGLSGSTYAFEKEIRNVLHKDLYFVAPSAAAALPIDSVIATILRKEPKAKIKNIVLHGEGRSIQVNLKNKLSIFVHPQTGAEIGRINQETEFLGIILKIHRQLYLGEPGKKITGISCLIFFISLLSGLFLWWPKNKRNLKEGLQLETKKGPKRLLYDSHRSIGFYALIVLIPMSVTGLVFSFKWFEKFMYIMAGSQKKEIRYQSKPAEKTKALAIGSLLQSVANYYPSKTIAMVLPDDKKGAIRISVQLGSSGLFTANDTYFFDQFSGEKLSELLYSNQTLAERLRASNYNFHTGKVLGLAGEISVFIAGLIAASLPITGFLMWRNKGKKKQKHLPV